MRDYDVGYYLRFDPIVAPPLVAGPVGAGFNALSRVEPKTGRLRTLPMDRRSTLQEPAHIPSTTKDHEGYLAFVVDIHDEPYSQVWVVEASRIEDGPIAKIHLPLRLRPGVHGNWVPTSVS
jgi:carotenoid cleavage dioxygenase